MHQSFQTRRQIHRQLNTPTILATMPTDAALENAWQQAAQNHQATGTIPGWGDAICWNELHHTTPYHNTWD